MSTVAVVIAAGAGTRMKSTLPKPLHPLVGRPMLLHVLDATAAIDLDAMVVVVGHGGDRVTAEISALAPALPLRFIEQAEQRGTGDAVAIGLSAVEADRLADDSLVVVLPGDTPLLRPASLAELVEVHRSAGAAATVLTARVPDPTGYGRVIRGEDGRVLGIIEHRDASPEERLVDEINTSVFCFRGDLLGSALRELRPDNDQGELYLTDTIGLLRAAGHGVAAHCLADAVEASGVNDRRQLAEAEAELRQRLISTWQSAGVTFVDPDSTHVDAAVELAADVTVQPGCILRGVTVVGEGAEIGPHAALLDSRIGAGARVEHATARSAEVGPGAVVGPFAVLEPGASVPAGAVVGPFEVVSPDEAGRS
jgi:bifunctional UDP-N-acetylglucosamine pyrophosphorylase/glucosamine-1-phosphate N-acetyltransferase